MSLISNCLESPFNRGGLTSNMETGPAGFSTLYPPSRWIPAPRFHEDKLRGNDRRECPPEADRESEGVPRPSPFFSPKTGGQRGLNRGIQFRIEAR